MRMVCKLCTGGLSADRKLTAHQGPNDVHVLVRKLCTHRGRSPEANVGPQCDAVAGRMLSGVLAALQKVVSMSEFELALLDFRKKASAGQVGSQPEQQQHRQEGGSCDGHQEADVSEHQGLSGDGPETPPKLHSAGSPPPARSSTAGGAGAAEGSAGPPGQSPPASSAAAQGAAGGPQGVSPAAAGGPAAAEGAAQHAAPKPSAFAAHSLSPTSADDWSPATQHVPLPPRTSRANRYDLLLGD